MARLELPEWAHNLLKMIQLYRGVGRPRVAHALIVIFAEFFAWGLLTTLTIGALKSAFPGQTLMINGLIWGIKGTLSFLMSPPIGYLSDVFGRKPFLLLTVLFTCLPIPVLFLSTWWFFVMMALSGLFAVTFSVAFAYVADLTSGSRRSAAYGQVSATFAASLIISPALGAHLSRSYGDTLVLLLATSIAVLDVLFILFIMPESLPEKSRQPQLTLWEQSTPLTAIRKIGREFTIWIICLTVFLSYLPEAGQYSCFFVYLKLVVGFSEEQVATFIAFIGILSVIAQTVLMTFLVDRYGGRNTILTGLLLQAAQLLILGFCQRTWLIWLSGLLASLSSITYPAISAYISSYAEADKQGFVQGVITGVRSLCGGIGPFMFGLLFNIFNVDIYEQDPFKSGPQSSPSRPLSTVISASTTHHNHSTNKSQDFFSTWVVGPPFLFGAILVLLASMVASFIPDTIMPYKRSTAKSTSPTNYYRYTNVSDEGSSGAHENGLLSVSNHGNRPLTSADHCELLDDMDDLDDGLDNE